jgi:hypothetical protein
MEYSTQPGFPAHRDCANFRNGLCTLNGVAVNPNGTACPRFTPKSVMATPQAVRAYPGARQPYQPYPPPQIGYSLPPPYAYPPWIGYRHGYPTPQYRRGYSYSSPTAPKQGGAGFVFMSGGRRGRGGGRGRGRMGGFAAGPGGSCVCPSCGYSASHVVGIPCYQQTCPKCGSRMTRGR